MSSSIKKNKTLPQIPLFTKSVSTIYRDRPNLPIRKDREGSSKRKVKILPIPPQFITKYTSRDLEYDSNINLLENIPRTIEEWSNFWNQIGVSYEPTHISGTEIMEDLNNILSIINYNKLENTYPLNICGDTDNEDDDGYDGNEDHNEDAGYDGNEDHNEDDDYDGNEDHNEDDDYDGNDDDDADEDGDAEETKNAVKGTAAASLFSPNQMARHSILIQGHTNVRDADEDDDEDDDEDGDTDDDDYEDDYDDDDDDDDDDQSNLMSQTLESIISNAISNRRNIVSDNIVVIPIIINVDTYSDSEYSDSEEEEEDPPPQYTE